MQLSRKQVIVISAVSVAILLLAVAAILIFTPGDEEAPPQPTPAPTETIRPTATPAPAPTPMPTTFLLPLVPRWDTPGHTAQPSDMANNPTAGAFVPPIAPMETEEPWM